MEEPLTHHAMHLAKVREACSKSPMDILKNSRAAATKNYSALSLVVLFDWIKCNNERVTTESSKNFSKGKFAAGVGSASKSQEVEMENGDLSFDDLEAIENAILQKSQADAIVPSEEKQSFSKSVWLNLTGGSKAAKFKV